MQREKLINPTFEEVQELRVAVQNAEEHFPCLRICLFEENPQMALDKYNALYGLYKSNKMAKALGLARSFFDDACVDVPDDLYGMSYNKRRFYIVELLLLLNDWLNGFAFERGAD